MEVEGCGLQACVQGLELKFSVFVQNPLEVGIDLWHVRLHSTFRRLTMRGRAQATPLHPTPMLLGWVLQEGRMRGGN